MQITDSMLIGFSLETRNDTAVLTVGKKRINGSVEVINAFSGKEAVDLWKKLTQQKEPSE